MSLLVPRTHDDNKVGAYVLESVVCVLLRTIRVLFGTISGMLRVKSSASRRLGLHGRPFQDGVVPWARPS